MNEAEINGVPTHRRSRVHDEAFFTTIRQKLSEAGNVATPMVLTNKSLFDGLATQLAALHMKGFSFQELSSLLSQCGVELPPNSISEHLHRLRTKQLLACEKQITRYYELACDKKSEDALRIERGLRVSLKENSGLILHFQPQVDMFTHEVVGAEALVRWKYEGKLVPPLEFISIAEECGLIVGIGEWVLREACSEAKRWQKLGLGGERGIKMAVNLSVKQFSSELPDTISGILFESGLPTRLLGLEITESCFAGKGSLSILQALRDIGLHLSIDDFGTGFSCLSELKDFPVDTIKIDHSFVKGLTLDDGSMAVVETIVELAAKMGMNTLAEGVETQDQASLLKAMGCSVCQGYLYSQAVPGDAFIEFVKGQSTDHTKIQ